MANLVALSIAFAFELPGSQDIMKTTLIIAFFIRKGKTYQLLRGGKILPGTFL